jgi:hypothetical protein
MSSPLSWIRAVCAVSLILIASIAIAAGAAEVSAPDRKSVQPDLSGTPATGNQSDIEELKRQLKAQQQQIEELRLMLQEQAKLIGYGGAVVSTRTQPAASAGSRVVGEVASMTPMIPAASSATPPPVMQQPEKKEGGEQAAPLQFQIGNAYLTPIGFMDFTAVFRDVATGTGIGTNFGNFPYRTAASVPGNLTEFRFSPQNSRLGMRIDTQVKGTKVLGYWESDFLGGTGNQSVGNIAVTSNSFPFRLRLYWVDVRKGKLEFLGGQTWSLATPGRKGISPLPADLFYTQVIDVNYQLGLVWGRIPELRFVYHPSDKVTMAVALDNPEQYIGGSGGAGATVLPTNLVAPYSAQLNNGTTTLAVPNLHPDIIAKVAFDPTLPNGRALHFEVGALARTFKVYNPLTATHFTATGWGTQANLNIELFKGFRAVTNNYWSDGGGRYIFGQSPDLVARNDGSLSLVRSGSTVDGFEFTHKNFLLYAYYGGVYIQRNAISAPNNDGLVGYGFNGSANSQNRAVQEGTIGFTDTFWKDAKYGALAFMAQYSYFIRAPWFVASGAPGNTHMNMVLLNLRYTLPGSAPAPK